MSLYPAELYRIQQQPSTVGSIAILVATLALASSPHQPPRPFFSSARAIERQSTVGQFGNQLATTSEMTGFEEAVAAFYSTLLSNQETLGHEFEQILHDNLWNLYVRS